MRGEPGDRVNVEVVGRLVEHEHVAVVHEHARQVHATPLATGELADSAVPWGVGDEAADDGADAGVRCPRVLGHISDHDLRDGGRRVQRLDLFECGDRDVVARHDPAVVGLDSSREEGQERGLAVAVAAKDADTVALVDAERDRVEHPLRWVLEVDVLASEQVRQGGSSILVAVVAGNASVLCVQYRIRADAR